MKSTFRPLSEEPEPEKPRETAKENGDGNIELKRAEAEAIIAEHRKRKRLAEADIVKIEELSEKSKQLDQEKREFENQKTTWTAEFNKQKTEEIKQITKVKEYWESKEAMAQEVENGIATRTEELDLRQQVLDAQEDTLNSILRQAEANLERKRDEVIQLQAIIDKLAPQYYKDFKQMLDMGEARRNWNYNTARGDQWHNLTERIRIIFECLHRMLFGE